MSYKYEDDIHALRREFLACVDTDDPTSIQQWFARHPYLTTNDHARIVEKSTHYVRMLKRKAGIRGRTPKHKLKPHPRRTIDNISVPPDWDRKEWLETTLKTHSIAQIARAVGLSSKTISSRLKKYGIKPPSYRASINPKNPYFSYDWCYEHYITKQWSQEKCAKAAGIGTQSFVNWLNYFNIPVRKALETFNNNASPIIWVRETIQNLENLDIVNRAMPKKNHIYVRYKSRVCERYYIDGEQRRHRKSYDITREQAKLDYIPKILLEFENEIGDDEYYPAHVKINREDWDKSSLLAQRVAVHELTRLLCRRGWIWPRCPNRILESDRDTIFNDDILRFLKNDNLSAYSVNGEKETFGFRLISHFYGLSELGESIFNSPRRTYRIVNHVTSRTGDINTHRIMKAACYHPQGYWKIKIFDPSVYTLALKLLNVKGPVLDLYPNYGHRAIACAALGLKYFAKPTQEFQEAVDNGFAEFLGLDYEPYGGQDVDIVLSDDDFRFTDIDIAFEYAKKTKSILHFVQREHRAFQQSLRKPRRVMPILTRANFNDPDYLFLF